MPDVQELEERLRSTLRAVARAAEPPAGLSGRLTAGPGTTPDWGARRTSWRPILAGTTAVGLAVIGVFVVQNRLAGSSVAPAQTRKVVPWNGIDQRHVTTKIYPSLPPQVPAATGTPVCRNTDFRLVSSRSSPLPESGWVSTSYVLRSVGAADCSVSVYGLDATLVDASGQALPEDAGLTSGKARSVRWLVVQPGQLVSTSAQWANVAGTTARPARIAVLSTAPLGADPDTRLSIPVQHVDAPAHPRNPTTRGAPRPWRSGVEAGRDPRVVDPGSLGSLTAEVNAPASVASGAELRFTVDLRNPTDRAVSLTPCPEVVTTLDVFVGKAISTTGWRGPLNCAQAPASIPPGGVVRFAVELPAMGEPVGDGLVSWTLSVDGSDQVTTSVRPQVTP